MQQSRLYQILETWSVESTIDEFASLQGLATIGAWKQLPPPSPSTNRYCPPPSFWEIKTMTIFQLMFHLKLSEI